VTLRFLPFAIFLGLVLAASSRAEDRGQPEPQAPKPGSAPALWIEAQQIVDGDSAVDRYRRIAQRFPRHPLGQESLSEMADYEYARGEYDAARTLYARVRGAESKRARLGEALSTFALGDPQRALAQARLLVHGRDDPYTWLGSLLIAECWQAEGRLPETLAAYRHLLDLPAGPAQPAALLGAARSAERSGEHEEADGYLKKLRQRFPDSPEAAEARSFSRAPRSESDAGGEAPALPPQKK